MNSVSKRNSEGMLISGGEAVIREKDVSAAAGSASVQNGKAAAGRKRRAAASGFSVRYLVAAAMLSAVAVVLQYIEFSIPVMPSFIKLDLSDLPSLIGSFAMGPLWGGAIAGIKNLLHMMASQSGGVGELANFLINAAFVMTAGFIYQFNRTRKGALIGSFVGAAAAALISVPINYFIVYPFYTAFMPMDAIINAYKVIFPGIQDGNLLQCLLVFNLPFTFVKSLLSVVIVLLVYKRISPLIHGAGRRS